MCSAVQNQDFTVVQDYITGLKALLYMNGRGGAAERCEKRQPTPALVKDALDLSDDYDEVIAAVGWDGVQTFGPYLRAKRCAQATRAAAQSLGGAKNSAVPDVAGSAASAKTVSPVKENSDGNARGQGSMTPVERAVGHALKTVGAYKSLDRRAQVVALVNEVGRWLGTNKLPAEDVDGTRAQTVGPINSLMSLF